MKNGMLVKNGKSYFCVSDYKHKTRRGRFCDSFHVAVHEMLTKCLNPECCCPLSRKSNDVEM